MSNASDNMRAILQDPSTVEPEVSSSDIEKVMLVARSSFYYAVKLYKMGERRAAFSQFKKFQQFVSAELPPNDNHLEKRVELYQIWTRAASDSAENFISMIVLFLESRPEEGAGFDGAFLDELGDLPVPEWIDATPLSHPSWGQSLPPPAGVPSRGFQYDVNSPSHMRQTGVGGGQPAPKRSVFNRLYPTWKNSEPLAGAGAGTGAGTRGRSSSKDAQPSERKPPSMEREYVHPGVTVDDMQIMGSLPAYKE